MSLLTTHELSLQRGEVNLHFPDLNVEAGEHLLLLGPSGSGKTSLLSLISGLLRPSTGSIHFAGQTLEQLTQSQLDKLRGESIGFIFQTLHLLPALSIRQNILLAPEMAGLPANTNELEQLLKELGLADKADRKPAALSQGEQQRAAIARAIINKPKLIIADEPTSALDADNAAIVADLLVKQASKTGASLIVATHDERITQHFNKVLKLGASHV